MNIIEITNAYETAEEALADWSFTGDDEVMKVVERAARHIADKYADTCTTSFDDAHQDGLVLMATSPGLYRAYRSDDSLGLGALHTRLIQVLTKQYRTEAGHRSSSKLTSWELNNEKLAVQGY